MWSAHRHGDAGLATLRLRAGQLLDEARLDAVACLPVQQPALREAQIQPPPRACDRHIHQPALLFQPAFVIDRTLTGKQTLFHADQEHHRKFQSLGRMQGHQLHAVVPRFALVLAGLQCGVRQERRQFVQAGLDVVRGQFEAAGDVDQFVQVEKYSAPVGQSVCHILSVNFIGVFIVVERDETVVAGGVELDQCPAKAFDDGVGFLS